MRRNLPWDAAPRMKCNVAQTQSFIPKGEVTAPGSGGPWQRCAWWLWTLEKFNVLYRHLIWSPTTAGGQRGASGESAGSNKRKKHLMPRDGEKNNLLNHSVRIFCVQTRDLMSLFWYAQLVSCSHLLHRISSNNDGNSKNKFCLYGFMVVFAIIL